MSSFYPTAGHEPRTCTREKTRIRLPFGDLVVLSSVMKNNTQRIAVISASARTHTRVVGQNSEMAEMGNPRGDVFSQFGNVEAMDEKGQVFTLIGQERELWDDADEKIEWLDKMAAAVQAAGSIDPELWSFTRWSYGSEGWDEQEKANEVADEEKALWA